MRTAGIALLLNLVILTTGTSVFADGDPGPRNTYGRDRLGGMRGEINWQSLLSGEGLDGWTARRSDNFPDGWSWEGDTVVGQIPRKKYGRIVTGDPGWKSYVFSVRAALDSGSNLQIAFRASEDGKSYYFLDFLTKWRSVAISKKVAGVPGVTKLDVVNFPIEKGREYDITIAARGNSIISYIDGEMVNRLSDGTFTIGRVGFLMWHDTKVRFWEPKIRLYH
jgi:hypothetical protein